MKYIYLVCEASVGDNGINYQTKVPIVTGAEGALQYRGTAPIDNFTITAPSGMIQLTQTDLESGPVEAFVKCQLRKRTNHENGTVVTILLPPNVVGSFVATLNK